MKIGIVTFYRVANYGAMLQAYALWKCLGEMGHEVEFIRHPRVAPGRLKFWRCFVSRSLQSVRIKLKLYLRFHIADFAKDYPQTEVADDWTRLRQIGTECDAYIVGSDQMWNPMWCSSNEFLPFVMLDFVATGRKRLSYAVSFGTKEWREDQNLSIARRLIKKFDAISVREQSGVALANLIGERDDARCLIDPTMLHDASFYRVLFGKDVSQSSYVFKYLLDEFSDTSNEAAVVERVKVELGIESIKTDRAPAPPLLRPLCGMIGGGVSGKVRVEKWLELIAGAKFVVTNSFHGTVFAILFHRPFISLLLHGKMSGMNERMVSLLNQLGLCARAIYPDELCGVGQLARAPIDWGSVDARLTRLRGEAKNFLQQVL